MKKPLKYCVHMQLAAFLCNAGCPFLNFCWHYLTTEIESAKFTVFYIFRSTPATTVATFLSAALSWVSPISRSWFVSKSILAFAQTQTSFVPPDPKML